jgi:hypothetical protein
VDQNVMPTYDHSALVKNGDNNPETIRLVALVKQQEEAAKQVRIS